MEGTLYITGAGVSAESGIPTFRGEDGFWTIGSNNYTPQEMATRRMYLEKPDEFLLWYYQRFVSYRNVKPNKVHYWLSNKKLITQNIDGLDGKAGNKDYIPIHGRLDKVTVLNDQRHNTSLIDAPWNEVAKICKESSDKESIKKELLNVFRISLSTLKPEPMVSLKPFVLLFDEYYTDLFRIRQAEEWMNLSNKFIFIGTSFSVNITSIALKSAVNRGCNIEVVDPKPIDLNIKKAIYHKMTAKDYISKQKQLNTD